MDIRLQKVLAAAGVGSRRHCEELIASGRVCVDGQAVTELGTRVDPEKAVISVDGKPIGQASDKIYLILNKPAGYTCTRSDPHAKRTVIELLGGACDASHYLFPVGRLDVDSSGLLIVTNDGELTHLLTHPSYGVEKTYRVVVRGSVEPASLRRLEQGVELEDGPTVPARARLVLWSRKENTSTVDVTIHEGRKRQVRRMFDAVGHPVVSLTRTRIGNLELGELKQGECRRLTKNEIAQLTKLATEGGS